MQVRLDGEERKRASGEVQLPEAWEQNQGKWAGKKRGRPGLWPHSKVFILVLHHRKGRVCPVLGEELAVKTHLSCNGLHEAGVVREGLF